MLKNTFIDGYNEKYQIVQKVINRWDPMRLLHFAPEDEYQPEIARIVAALHQSPTIEALAAQIVSIFRAMFGKQFAEKNCHIIAERIWLEVYFDSAGGGRPLHQ